MLSVCFVRPGERGEGCERILDLFQVTKYVDDREACGLVVGVGSGRSLSFSARIVVI